MAITTVKPIYLDSNGIYRNLSSDTSNGNKIAVAELQVTKDAAANRTLVMDSSGNLSPALITNDNISSTAAIAGTKIDGSTIASLNADNISSGTLNDSRLSSNVALKSYVDAIAAGIDYKQEARWYLGLNSDKIGTDFSKYTALKALNGTIDFPTGAPGSVKSVSNVEDSGGTLKITTSSAHGFSTGDKIRISGVTAVGTATINNLAYTVSSGTNFAWTITVVDTTSFTLDGSSSTGFTSYTSGGNAFKCSTVPGESGYFAANDRIVFDLGGTTTDTGIYVLGGSSGSWTATRSTDMAAGADAAGAYVYAQSEFSPDNSISNYKKANIIQQAKGAAVVGTNNLTFAVYGAGSSYTFSAPLSESSGTVSLTIESDTLEVSSSALKVTGLPLSFKINGSGVSSNFTKSNADKLVDGVSQDASALHRHLSNIVPYVNTSAQTVGKAVSISAGNTVYASKSDGKVFGIIHTDAASGQPYIAVSGAAVITTPAGSPSFMDNLYLNTSGDLCTFGELSSGDLAVKVGRFLGNIGPGGAPMIAIAIQEVGTKA